MPMRFLLLVASIAAVVAGVDTMNAFGCEHGTGFVTVLDDCGADDVSAGLAGLHALTTTCSDSDLEVICKRSSSGVQGIVLSPSNEGKTSTLRKAFLAGTYRGACIIWSQCDMHSPALWQRHFARCARYGPSSAKE